MGHLRLLRPFCQKHDGSQTDYEGRGGPCNESSDTTFIELDRNDKEEKGGSNRTKMQEEELECRRNNGNKMTTRNTVWASTEPYRYHYYYYYYYDYKLLLNT